MKVLTILFLLGLSSHVFASTYKVASLWKSNNAPSEMQYLATVENTDFYAESGEWLFIFGTNEEGNWIAKPYHLGGMDFYTYENASGNGTDDLYTMQYKVRHDQLYVSLDPRSTSTEAIKTIYTQYESSDVTTMATQLMNDIAKNHDHLRALPELTTLEQFKKRLKLVVWDYGFSVFPSEYENDENFPFLVYDFQIEFFLIDHIADTEFSEAIIEQDGKDVLSQTLRQGKTWHASSNDAVRAVIEEIENTNIDPWNYSYIYHSSFSEQVFKMKDSVLKNAAKKFVRYEIVNASAFICEGEISPWEEVTWVLIDGSTYTYTPGTECD